MVVNFFDNSNIQLTIDKKLYSSEVIHKCFYWYGGKYSIDIKDEKDFFIINLSVNNNSNIEKIISKIKTDLIDFQTREIISIETKNIREILLAKAFANSDEFDEIPPGDLNDPIGFDAFQF